MSLQLLNTITPSHFRELIKEGISLDLVYLLTIIKNGGSLGEFKTRKEQSLIQTLYRRFLITEENKLTLEGEKIFEFLKTDGDIQGYLKPSTSDDGFDRFWKAYPNTDAIVQNKKVIFPPTRSLKGDKQEAAQLLRQILGEGEFTIDQIIQALEYEVKMKIENSLKLKENKMKYMQNSSTWLRQRTFVQFVSIADLEVTKEKSAGVVNI